MKIKKNNKIDIYKYLFLSCLFVLLTGIIFFCLILEKNKINFSQLISNIKSNKATITSKVNYDPLESYSIYILKDDQTVFDVPRISLLQALENKEEIKNIMIYLGSHKSTPKELSLFTNLKELNLAGSVIDCYESNQPCYKSPIFTTIDPSLISLTKLEKLTIDGYDNINSIPDFIYDFPNLKELFITQMTITSLSENISNLKNLEKLTFLSTHELKTLPSSINQLKKLKELNFIGPMKIDEKEKEKIDKLLPKVKISYQ